MSSDESRAGALLCTMNYPANGGYAWAFIERLCGQIADRLGERGVPTYVAYPAIPAPPDALAGSSAVPVVLDIGARGWRGALGLVLGVRRLGARVAYVSDRPTYSWRYPLLRLGGVRWIVVHAHGSGGARAPSGVLRLLKAARARLPWIGADVLVAVSEFVATRERTAALTPARRIVRVWNAIPVPDTGSGERARRDVRRELEIADDAVVIVTTSRASKEKGIDTLLRAFDTLARETGLRRDRLRLVFVGGGVHFDELAGLVASLPTRDQIDLVGPRRDAHRYVDAGDVVAVPSVYQDALPLAVLEGMAHGRPVVGSTVGGIPEMVRDGCEGLLVPPGDERALASALRRLVEDADLRASLGANARRRVAEHFAPDRMVAAVVAVLEPGWASGRAA